MYHIQAKVRKCMYQAAWNGYFPEKQGSSADDFKPGYNEQILVQFTLLENKLCKVDRELWNYAANKHNVISFTTFNFPTIQC